MNDLKISIIVPSFNQGRFIEETILSILNQTYSNFEIIVVDGGSTDNTMSVLKKYEKQLKYWISEKDSGQSEAINKGMRIATGEIATWLNSDDIYEPGALEEAARQFEKESVHLLHGKARLFGDKIKEKIVGLSHDIQLHEYLPYMRFPQPSSFFRKTLLDKVEPVNEQLHYAMDFELVVRSILLGARPRRSDKVLSGYRFHENSKSNHDLKFLAEWTSIVYNVFCTLKGGEKFAEKMKQLELPDPKKPQHYKSSLILDEDALKSVFLEHLHLHYHYNYRALNKSACEKISAYLEKNYPVFFEEKNFKKYNTRLKFIPEPVFKLIRRIKV